MGPFPSSGLRFLYVAIDLEKCNFSFETSGMKTGWEWRELGAIIFVFVTFSGSRNETKIPEMNMGAYTVGNECRANTVQTRI